MGFDATMPRQKPNGISLPTDVIGNVCIFLVEYYETDKKNTISPTKHHLEV